MSKKSLLSAAVLVAAISAVSACGGSGSDAGANTEVNILGYAALFEDKYTEAVISKFEEEHSEIDVNFVPAQNSAEMLGKLRSEKANPTVDVAIIDTSVANTGNKEGIFSKITEDEVPNLANVVDMGKSADGYGPAVTFDNLVVLHNTEKVPQAPNEVGDLWNAPDKSVAIPAPPDIQGIALTVLTANNLGDDYKQSIDPAIAKLGELAPKVTTWDPQPDVYQTVISGQAQYAIGWNARAQVFSDESGGTLGVVQPEDGVAFQINTINAVEGAKNADAAKTFIDFALSKEAQESFADTMFYTPTVSNAELSEDTKKRVASPEDPNIVDIDWNWMSDERDSWTEQWRRGVIGG
ncbi:putative spermidine/putrescine transport system substrate-binding protein [Brevibacterium sanguinis]|uniref:Spermidine/putrescine transport system substrate-binding protein n=2 Tax=Brevibacterium TaxID=1696 RepID=A0ABX9GR06_9MICO|nr:MULTISPECIES: extracellular solute-binding protein [Brevibacterium]RBP66081.1 putative spermidine/putrescine transport system substrate-binding protein [Brevibacterium sanguinis]RBP72732.1 putative spermidine/putrescine transport system substrate-binding protein [Brevibacterium celere]